MRVVIDTVVFVRSLLNPYSRSGRIIFDHAGDYTLVISEPVIREILEVLRRPEITRKVRVVAGMDMARILNLLAQAEPVTVEDIPSISRDPKDDMFLATARAAGASCIVSEDKDLLVLGEYEGIRIVDGGTFLDILEADGGHQTP